ncbi:MAG: M48 family metalloprotease [Terriglobales bacterium]
MLGQEPGSHAPERSAQGRSLSPPSSASTPASFKQVIDTVVQRERFFVAQMRHFHPLVETYVQNLKGNEEKAVPVSDQYFLGRLQIANGPEEVGFKDEPGFRQHFMSKLTGLFRMKFLPLGFAQMVMLDDDFKAKDYNFGFVRREFLSEVRCLVIDVQPKQKSSSGRFIGRMWVEDQNYNIVRFNGTYVSRPHERPYLHFDSWRLNLRPGVWLPAYIYSEESNTASWEGHDFHFKAQTRLWGYDLHRLRGDSEFTQIVVDAAQGVKDQNDGGQDASPLESERKWEHQAEDNAIERLQNIGLLAPPGDVDKILMTVINNLIVTNNLDIEPEVRARVLLTTPLESFTVGHTIVLSRGLLDVLPDEASLAMVLAHELAHIALGHRLDTELAFGDRMFFPDVETFERLDFRRSLSDEEAADAKAMDLLAKSPYKDKLGNAGLFLKQLQLNAPVLRNLIRPHFGDRLVSGKTTRMAALLSSAPDQEPERTDQIAALPLGARIRVDPWSDRAELIKTTPVALVSPRERMPFEVSPFFPFLKRSSGDESTAATTSPR